MTNKLASGLPETMTCLKKLAARRGLDLVKGEKVPTTLQETDCLIRVTHAGVCGTDRHIYEWDAWASGRMKNLPVITGHEFVGRVVAVGEACRHRKVGDRVSAEGHLGCGDCPACRQGEAHICERVDIIGIDTNGCFAGYLAMPESNCWLIPESIPDRVAAIMDPLGNAMHTVMAAGVSGKNVLITGAGTIGLMAVLIARHAGAADIFVTDVNADRLAIAERLGAKHMLSAKDRSWSDKVRSNTGGHGVDVLLEMSGNQQAISDGLDALRNGGTAALLGLPSAPVSLDFPNQIIFKGATILGINGRRMYETWYQVERFLLAQWQSLDPILTHELPLVDYEEGFHLLETGAAIKVVLNVESAN